MKKVDPISTECRIRFSRTPNEDSIMEVCELMAAERNQPLAKFIPEVLVFHPYIVHRLQQARGEFKIQPPPVIAKEPTKTTKKKSQS